MRLDLSHKEAAGILRRRAAGGRAKINGPKLSIGRAKPKHGRERDRDFLAWLHEGLPCIACMILGPGPTKHAHIEAAHQKIQGGGLNRKLGVRPDDWQTVPLCAWHHRIAPNCCDPAQRKFWETLNVDPASLCRGLYAAFEGRADGMTVIRSHVAQTALANRPEGQ